MNHIYFANVLAFKATYAKFTKLWENLKLIKI